MSDIRISPDNVLVDGAVPGAALFTAFNLTNVDHVVTELAVENLKLYNFTLEGYASAEAYEWLKAIECNLLNQIPERNLGGFVAAASSLRGIACQVELSIWNRVIGDPFKQDLILKGCIANLAQTISRDRVTFTFFEVNKLWVRETGNVIKEYTFT